MDFITNNITPLSTGFIILVFLFFIYQALKVYKLSSILKKVNKSEDRVKALSETKRLVFILDDYKKSINIDINGEKKTNIPSSEFFSEFKACKVRSINMRMLDTASGTLVGLGLLGTFLGLTLGIQNFDSSNTENIQKSIQTLLSGMGTAFFTSLVGMSLSLIYTIFDKRWRNKLSRQLFDLTEKLDSLYYIDDVTLNILHQQKMMDGLYVNIKNMMETQTRTVMAKSEANANAIQEKLVYANSEGKLTSVGNAIREILTENVEQSRALKSFSTDLALELNNGFDESLSRQMQQKILPLMENVNATTRAIVEHIDSMAEKVSAPATDMIQNVVNELKGSMSAVIDGFSGNATRGLEELVSQLGIATQTMGNFPTQMETMSATLQSTIEDVKNAMAEISASSANASSTTMQQMQEQMTLATASISQAINEVKEVMNGITQTSQEQTDQMMLKLAEAAEKMSDYLNGTVSALSASVTDSVKGITDNLSQKQEGLLAIQQNTMTEIRNVMSGITQSTQEQNAQMVNNMTVASEKMSSFLSETVSSLSSTMQESVKNITEDVNNKQADLMALQEGTTAETRKLLETFNQGLERLEMMNKQITGTMNQFQIAQGYITDSTEHLQNITGDMAKATEQFKLAQAEYTTKINEMQRNSQQSIEDIIKMMNDTGEMSQDYVEKFETIKDGIANIFAQLQSGLTEYSRTVQATTQKYLEQYSSKLTETTDALSSTIQSQMEIAEMLADSLNSRKR